MDIKSAGNKITTETSFFRFFVALTTLGGLLWFGGFSYLRHEHETLEKMYLGSRTMALDMAWKTEVKSYQVGMQAYFETYIMQPQVLEILRTAYHADESGQAEQRARLYRELYPVYQKLQKRNVRQLHFHTPDNRSFLRFHAPQYSGDSLVASRPSVVTANREHRVVQGFETGRVVAGFRNVFPIIHDGEDLGSVEISQPFESLRREMWQLDNTNDFMLVYNAALILPKLIEEQKKVYAPSPFSPDWLVEDPNRQLPDSPPVLSAGVQTIFAGLAESQPFLQSLSQGQPHSLAVRMNDRFYKVTSLPLVDLEGLVAAVLLSLSPAPELDIIHQNFSLNLLAFTSMLAVGCMALLLLLQSKKDMAEKQQFLQLMADTMNDGLYVMDKNGVITFVNTTASRILGYSREELIGRVAHDLFHVHDTDVKPLSECPIYNVLSNKIGYIGEERFTRRDGGSFMVEIAGEPMVKNGRVISVVAIFRDITDRKQMEEKLLQLCNTDPLTTAFNRRYFQQILESEVERAKRYATPFALMMCDVDHFKKVNDTFGHETGDKVLREIVATVHRRIRGADVFARWGGEEFVLLMANTTLPDAASLVEDLLTSIRLLDIDGVGTITASCGVTAFQQEDTIDTLLSRADKLLYAAKAAGRDCIRVGV